MAILITLMVAFLNNIEHQFELKQLSDSRECTEKGEKVITKERTEHNNFSDKAYIKMTIQKIIKDKIMEIQSFDTGQLKAKLIRMEEDNFNLRNRTLVLEERVKYLEDKCKARNISIDDEEDAEENFNLRIDCDEVNENGNKTTSNDNEDELSPPGEKTWKEDEHVVIKEENDITESTATTELTETTTTVSPQTENNSSESPQTWKQSEAEEEVTTEINIKEEEKEVIDLEILPDELISPRESDPTRASLDNLFPAVSPRPRPEYLNNPDTNGYKNGYKSRDVITKYSTGSTRETSASDMNRPIPSLVPISLLNSNSYDSRNSVPKGNLPNHNVELYEKKLLGQISSPSSNKRVNMETQGPGPREYSYSKADNLLVRTARDYFKLNNDNLPKIVEYGQLKQVPSQGRTEASIYTNTAGDDLVVRYSGNFESKPMRISQEQQNNYKTYDSAGRHSELINEKRNTYMNNYPPQPSMQRKMVPYTYTNSNAKYNKPKTHLSPMELQRYENNRNLENYVSSSNSLSKTQLKRPSSGYLNERNDGYPPYEPLSKVSSKPPPLIPGHNLNPQQLSRFSSSRTMNHSREQHGVQRGQPGQQSSTVAKYNISATNFHATSRTPSSYQMTNPYMESPTSYPSDFDTRLALPQLHAQITSDKSSIIFTWDKMNNASHMFIDNVDVYFLFAFHTLDLNQPPPKETTYWKRISVVNPLPLPIACTLTQSFDGQNYFFAVAAVNRAGVVGQLSNPCALKVAL